MRARSIYTSVAAGCVAGAVAVSGLAWAAIPKAGTFRGTTSQVNPETGQRLSAEVTVRKSRRRVKRVRFQFAAPCSDGLTYRSAFFAVPGPSQTISAKGKFRLGGDYSPPDLNPGETGRVTYSVKGTFTRPRRVKGTIRVQVDVTAPTGAITCDTAEVPYTAKR